MTKRAHTAQDGRRVSLMRLRTTRKEHRFITDNLTTDERRQALMQAVERKRE